MIVRTRVAPSPTGFPHVGTAYQALFDYVWAKKNQGQFLLRIEDTDVKRFVPGAEEVIYDSLNWLGLSPDEGPQHPGPSAPYHQSKRLGLYQKYAHQLVVQNDAYYCFCSVERLAEARRNQERQKIAPRYDRACRNVPLQEVRERLGRGEKATVRLRIPSGQTITVNDLLRGPVIFSSDTLDDQVLLKSDGFPTYHLAVVVDDYLWKITHVIRGEEWLPSAPKHVLLYRMLDWPEPVWVHLPLLKNPGGGKISKRHGHTSIFWYREEGFLPEVVLNFLALLEWTHPKGKEVFSLDEIIENFELTSLRKTAAVFDLNKLYWLNGVYLRQKTVEELYQALQVFARVSKAPNLSERLQSQKALVLRILPLVRERMRTLKDFEEMTEFFFKESVDVTKEAFADLLSFSQNIWKEVVSGLENLHPDVWDKAHLETAVHQIIERSQVKSKDVLMVMRVAVTGRKISPPLWESLEVLGKEKTLFRLREASKVLF